MTKILAVLLAIVIYAAILIPLAVVASWIWNSVMVSVFSLPHLTALQMYGIVWLIRLLIPINVSSAISKDR